MELWFIALASYFAVVYIFYLQNKNEKKPQDCYVLMLIIALAIMGTSSSYKPLKAFNRLSFNGALFVCLLLNITFNAFLISIITRSIYGFHISTIRELINDEFELIGERNIVDQLFKQNLVLFDHPVN